MIKKILRILCVICCAVCILSFIVTAFADRMLFSDNLIPDMSDDEYVTYMHSRISSALAEDEEYYGFDIKYLTDKIDDEQIRRICSDYFSQLQEYMRGQRESIDTISYPKDGYIEGIMKFADTLDKTEVEFDNEAAEEIASDAAAVTSGCFPVTSLKYLNIVKNFINSPILSLAKYYYIPLIVAFLFAALCVIIPGDSLISRFSLAASAMFIPSFAIFVFMYLVNIYDFGSKIVIAESPLRQLVHRCFEKACTLGLWICGLCAAIFGIIMLALLIVRCVIVIKKNGKDKVLTPGEDTESEVEAEAEANTDL